MQLVGKVHSSAAEAVADGAGPDGSRAVGVAQPTRNITTATPAAAREA